MVGNNFSSKVKWRGWWGHPYLLLEIHVRQQVPTPSGDRIGIAKLPVMVPIAGKHVLAVGVRTSLKGELLTSTRSVFCPNSTVVYLPVLPLPVVRYCSRMHRQTSTPRCCQLSSFSAAVFMAGRPQRSKSPFDKAKQLSPPPINGEKVQTLCYSIINGEGAEANERSQRIFSSRWEILLGWWSICQGHRSMDGQMGWKNWIRCGYNVNGCVHAAVVWNWQRDTGTWVMYWDSGGCKKVLVYMTQRHHRLHITLDDWIRTCFG